MTIIAAYEDKSKYWIASDSESVFDTGLKFEFGSKLIRKSNYIIGTADSYRIADLIKTNPENQLPSTIKSQKDIHKFCEELKLIAIGDGADSCAGEHEMPWHPVSAIIIAPCGLFSMYGDYQVHKIEIGYTAIGGGAATALGVLFFAKRGELYGKTAVQCAVEASMKHSSLCGGTCYIASVKKSTE